MSSIIGALIVISCILFTVSLPIHTTAFGKTLRNIAIACFLAALVPSVACNLMQQAQGGTSGGGLGVNPLELLGVVAIVSVVAYGILALRGFATGGRRGRR